jgi:2-desacetyl-2-hydroxyethyl bacteriochlorophyllide A dehydrogenase
MKAAVYNGAGGLAVREVPLPEIGPTGVLIKVAECGFCGSDHSMIAGRSLAEGTILGHEVSGTIARLGRDVSGWRAGQRVIIRPTFCGACRVCRIGKPYLCQNNRLAIGLGNMAGGLAQYVAVDSRMLIPVPDGLDSENAALAEAFASSLHGLKVSGVQGGSILVMGGGAIGLALVKILKRKGFGPIALSEPVEVKRDLALAFGADVVINPLAENLVLRALDETGGQGFDGVFECSGVPECVQQGLNSVAAGGTVCIISIMMKDIRVLPLTLNFKEVFLTGSYSNTHEENAEVLDWMADGSLDGRSLITDRIPLEDLPPVYEERIETGRAVKVMVKIGEPF